MANLRVRSPPPSFSYLSVLFTCGRTSVACVDPARSRGEPSKSPRDRPAPVRVRRTDREAYPILPRGSLSRTEAFPAAGSNISSPDGTEKGSRHPGGEIGGPGTESPPSVIIHGDAVFPFRRNSFGLDSPTESVRSALSEAADKPSPSSVGCRDGQSGKTAALTSFPGTGSFSRTGLRGFLDPALLAMRRRAERKSDLRDAAAEAVGRGRTSSFRRPRRFCPEGR